MPNKPVSEMPDLHLREAVAVHLYGHGYTDDNLRAIAIFRDGRWYKYPVHGNYTQNGKKILVTRDER
jgi:hypothetical protein